MSNMIRVNPFFRNGDIFNVVDQFFNRSLGDLVTTDMVKSQPQINIKETETSYDLEVAAPGLKKEDFSVKVEDDHLIISAETKAENKEEGENYKRREFNYSSFSRSYYLPDSVDAEGIKGKYENGILNIVVPKVKVKEPEGKVIEIS